MPRIAFLTDRQRDLLDKYLPPLRDAGFVAILASLIAQARGQSLQSIILGSPIAADDDRIVVALDPIADGALTVAAQPDVPRNLTVTVTDANASIDAGTVTITGEGPDGEVVTEVLDLTEALTLTGTKIFAKVTSAVVADLNGAASGDTIKIGVGNVIGLPNPIIATTAVRHVYLGGVRVASPTIAAQATTTDQPTSGINASAATYNGSKLLHVLVASGE